MATGRLRQLAVALGGPGLMSLAMSCLSCLLRGESFSGRHPFDVSISVGHDFGMEMDGFRAPGI